jgi:hypothetical protein
MSIIVDIIIKGVAICYQKEVEGKTVWRVLFPFDEVVDGKRCHNLYFNWRRETAPASRRIPLAAPNVWINITAVGAETETGEEGNFGNYAFNLTNNDPTYITHRQIKKKDGWADGTVLMTIDNAVFYPMDYIQDLTDERPILWGGRPDNLPEQSLQLPGTITHSVRARIELVNDGELTVTSNKLPRPVVISEAGNYTLTFDNDCHTVTRGRNDMFMFYEKTIEDVDDPYQWFWIGAPPLDKVSEPPGLAEGKPCLVVKVDDPTSIRNLP